MLRKLQQLKKRNEGFTIVEVMIVLAIAGLIILIVFLAIPALQRNSRNTQQRDSVSRTLAAVQEFANNNNGTLPLAANSAAVSGLAGLTNGKTATICAGATCLTAPTADLIQIDTGVTCSVTVHTAEAIGSISATDARSMVTATGASGRSYTSIFIVETNGGNFQLQCQSS